MGKEIRLGHCNFDVCGWTDGPSLDLLGVEALEKKEFHRLCMLKLLWEHLETPQEGDSLCHVQHHRPCAVIGWRVPKRVSGCFGVLGGPQSPLET